jgi:hypothetical protein
VALEAVFSKYWPDPLFKKIERIFSAAARKHARKQQGYDLCEKIREFSPVIHWGGYETGCSGGA